MSTRRGAVRCLLAAVLFGASAPAASVLANDMSALALAGLLYLGAAVAVAPAVARRPPELADIRASWKPVAVAAIAGGALGPALLIAGLARIGAATASILLNLELVATVALAATLFREHLGRRVISGAAVVTAGGALSSRQVVAALVIGAASYGLSITLWVKGARDLGAARGQVIFATAPFIGAATAWLALDDAVTAVQLVAAGLAAAGVAISLDSAHLHGHHHDPTIHGHEHAHDDGHHDHEHPDQPDGPHSHPHEHQELSHTHPHVPDLHHRHPHP